MSINNRLSIKFRPIIDVLLNFDYLFSHRFSNKFQSINKFLDRTSNIPLEFRILFYFSSIFWPIIDYLLNFDRLQFFWWISTNYRLSVSFLSNFDQPSILYKISIKSNVSNILNFEQILAIQISEISVNFLSFF